MMKVEFIKTNDPNADKYTANVVIIAKEDDFPKLEELNKEDHPYYSLDGTQINLSAYLASDVPTIIKIIVPDNVHSLLVDRRISGLVMTALLSAILSLNDDNNDAKSAETIKRLVNEAL